MQREPLSSPNIISVGYDEEELILEVEFDHGEIHDYLGVPSEKHTALMSAESPDSYFSHNIRGMYEYRSRQEDRSPSAERQ
ncbi:KTSC domain-containing protein [Pseudochryseolinea flava]|uniref:KTSC domain-containing protein n=1 Tax=Pseudochryseolinea flava TaxID=2059302 RepID=A0A364Y3F3_9BACT|nr:KTSC domain-containing protein [Pseudochryseolinea flava]